MAEEFDAEQFVAWLLASTLDENMRKRLRRLSSSQLEAVEFLIEAQLNSHPKGDSNRYVAKCSVPTLAPITAIIGSFRVRLDATFSLVWALADENALLISTA